MTTHSERTAARIEEIDKLALLSAQADALEALARDLAAKLDRLDERIRRNYSRGIDMDVRDDLFEILEADQ